MLSVLFYVFVFMYFAQVSKLSILSYSCYIVYCVLHYGIGVLFHLILLLLLFVMCRVIVYITVYSVRFWFHGLCRVCVFYASVVLMTWCVHVTGCMIHGVLWINAQYDMLRSPSVWGGVSMCWVLRLLRMFCVVGREGTAHKPRRLGHVG